MGSPEADAGTGQPRLSPFRPPIFHPSSLFLGFTYEKKLAEREGFEPSVGI